MNRERLLKISERWFRLLLRSCPVDFRDDMGNALVETYRDRAREALNRGGVIQLGRDRTPDYGTGLPITG